MTLQTLDDPDPLDVLSNWIEAHLARTGFLPVLGSEGLPFPYDLSSRCWEAAHSRTDLLPSLCRLTSAVGSQVERACTVLFLAGVVRDVPMEHLSDDDESDRRGVLASARLDAVELLSVDDIADISVLQWELTQAIDASLWTRVDALLEQWRRLESTDPLARLTAVLRIGFLFAHPLRDEHFVADWWIAYEGSQFSRAGDALIPLLAARLDDRPEMSSEPWRSPATMTEAAFRRVVAADAAATLLKGSAVKLNTVTRLLWAWCAAAIGVRLGEGERVRTAAAEYLKFATIAEHQPQGSIARPAFLSAALLYRACGDLDGALGSVQAWTVADPKSRTGWHLRAEIERNLGLECWPDSYEQFVRLQPEQYDSWEETELLSFALGSRAQSARDQALRDLAFAHPNRAAIHELMHWDWETFARLAPETKERWWQGLVFVCDPRVRDAFTGQPWRHAASCFGEAAAHELRVRVFIPAAQANAIDLAALPSKDYAQAKSLLGPKSTLGAMVWALRAMEHTNDVLGASESARESRRACFVTQAAVAC